LVLALAWTAPPLLAQITPNPGVPNERPVPITKGLVLNEIQFDPYGQDGGNEWIELHNGQAGPINVAGVQVKDSANVVLATLPSVVLPAGAHYVVHLGPVVAATLDNDLSDGRGNTFTGQAPGNYLGNDSGGVLVVSAQGKVLDAMFWGTGSSPRGAGYTAAVAANQWRDGRYLELSTSSGHARCEGSTLGRDVDWTDTNSPSDFMLDGGENAAFPTPGIRNDMFVFTKARAIHWTQAVVQEFLAVISTANQSSLSVTSAAHTNVVVSDPDMAGGFGITADHSFDLLYSGSAKTLNGSIAFDYVRNGTAGATSYSATASGTLTSEDGSVSLTFSYTKAESGFHKLTRTLTGTTSFTWTEGGQAYAYQAGNALTTTQTGQNAWTLTDNRNWSDWGGLNKTSTSSQTLTKQGDGKYHHVATQTQMVPPPPPNFGQSQVAFGVERLDYEADMDFGFDSGVSKTIKRLDVRLLDLSNSQVAMVELAEPATYAIARTGGQLLSPLGSFEVTLNETMRFGFPTPDPLDRGQDYTISDKLTRELVAGEFVERGTIDGPGGSLSYYIDAPMQQACGCGCGGTDCDCGSPDETTAGDVVGIAAGVGVAAGVCTWGTIVTTPAVITGVGAIIPAGIAGACATAGAVWWLVWDMW
jgi:hypothetical protein